MVDAIAEHFKSNCGFELGDCAPWFLRANRKSRWYRVPNTLGKICSHLYGSAMTTILPACGEELRKIEVDWLRVKPVVKVVGEFWAQMTESDGNFRMLEFLEKEGAEVSIEPISSWVLYLLHQMKARLAYRRKMEAYSSPWTAPRKAIASRASSLSKRLGYTLGGKIYLHHFHRLAKLLGVPDQTFASQRALSEMAEPYYNTLLRGGEGHLEVAKTLYYARHKVCHLVLALKPFGCLPSVQSDAVQASLVERFPEVSFLPIETSADGEIHAYSRVRGFVAEHPIMRHALYSFPRHPGVVSTAANFLLHVDQLMAVRFTQSAGSHPQREHGVNPASLGQIQSTQESKS
jgi:hypothetical protein